MAPSTEYSQFTAFLELIESMSAGHRTESVAVRDDAGRVVGLLTLDGGKVRFGVHLSGRLYLDEIVLNEAPRHAAALQKILSRVSLSRGEKDLLAEISPQHHAALCGLTARALRRIAALYAPTRPGIRPPEVGLPQLRLLNISFTPVELALAAGRRGSIRSDDAAVRVYRSPPEYADESWLFEWQQEDPSSPWPVQLTRLHERRLTDVASFGALGQRLATLLSARRLLGDRTAKRAELARISESLFYLVSSTRYLTLLQYQQAHLGRLLRAMEDFVWEASVRTPDPVPIQRSRPATLAGPAANSGSLRAGAPPPPLPTMTRAIKQPESRPGIEPAKPLAKSKEAEAPARVTPIFLSAPVLPAPSSRSAPQSELMQLDEAAWVDAASQLIEDSSWLDATSLLIAEASVPPAAEPSPPPSIAQPEAEVLPELVKPEPPAPTPEPEAPSPAPPTEVLPATAVQSLPVPAVAPRPPSFAPPLLSLCRLTARVEGRTILKDIELEIGSRGVYALMGPGGSGKSSLGGILSGRNRAASGWELSGEIRYEGAPLGSAARPVLIPQKLSRSKLPLRAYLLADLDDGIAGSVPDARLVGLLERMRLARLCDSLATPLASPGLEPSRSEWWRLAIARELIADPGMLCVDEPTAGMDDEEASPILELLREEGARRAILFVTHNQQHARRCSDYVILLAGGTLQEYRLTAEFFGSPASRAARDYVRTGGCSVASPDAPQESLDEALVPSAQSFAQEAAFAAASSAQAASHPSFRGPLDASVRLDSAPAAAVPGHQQSAPELLAPDVPSEVLWRCEAPELSLRGFSLRLSGRPIFSDLSFDIASRGSFVIAIENSGERKLLVRALCGPRPSTFQVAGRLRYGGQDLVDGGGPAAPQASAQLLVMKAIDYVASNLRARGRLMQSEQRAQATELVARAGLPELCERLNTEMTGLETLERRVLEIVRAIAEEPTLLVLEDPASGLSSSQRERLLAVIKQQAQRRAVLILAPDPASYSELGASVAWLTDGRMSARPLHSLASGEEVRAPAILPDAETTAAPAPPPAVPALAAEAPRAPARGRGPRGFQWLREGQLAGMPAPGLTNDLDYELDLVRSAGVSWLVTLTTEPLNGEALRAHGLQSLFFPIEDMCAPGESAAAELAARVADLLGQGQAVAFHCKAGLGRTGTMLAAQLIWEGMDAKSALLGVRSVEPGWVQSEQQIQFLSRYAKWLRDTQAAQDQR